MEQNTAPFNKFLDFAKKVKNSKFLSNPSILNKYRNSGAFGRIKYIDDTTFQNIDEIVLSGDETLIKTISYYYYIVDSMYRNSIDFLSTLMTYDYVVSPVFNPFKKINKEKINSELFKVVNQVDSLNLKKEFIRVTRILLIEGSYYGILRNADENKAYVIQDLPSEYCRHRYKNSYGLEVLEFNLSYFDSITDLEEKKELLKNFPKEIKKAYEKRMTWVEIPPDMGGICFYSKDNVPMLLNSISGLNLLRDAEQRESKRDENELYKLLIHNIPLDKDSEPVMNPEEALALHDSICEMLGDNDTIDVITSFGSIKTENVQDSASAAQSDGRINKYMNLVYNDLGIPSQLFNPDTSSSVPTAITKLEGLMSDFLAQYESWFNYFINNKFSTSSLSYAFNILPISIFNKEKIQGKYFEGAQYGFSKTYAGVALGMKQSQIIPMLYYENQILGMNDFMSPLRSSYTSSEKNNEETIVETSGNSHLPNEQVGRPSLDITEKTEKTVQNIESSGG